MSSSNESMLPVDPAIVEPTEGVAVEGVAAQAHEEPHLAVDPLRWKALFVIAMAQLMVVLDASIVNLALPRAKADLGISDANQQWMVTAYTLTFGGFLLLGGRIADTIGRKRAFIIGLIGFAGASALGGIAPNEAMLFAARALQGTFAALLAPAALSLITVTFHEPKERARAFGVYGAIAGGGAAGFFSAISAAESNRYRRIEVRTSGPPTEGNGERCLFCSVDCFDRPGAFMAVVSDFVLEF
jgi:sugar phosphate permease